MSSLRWSTVTCALCSSVREQVSSLSPCTQLLLSFTMHVSTVFLLPPQKEEVDEDPSPLKDLLDRSPCSRPIGCGCR
ncbi:GTP binding protein [Sesbania bispinosa]|nr:GTP binding protein [Sesbania bispinosa]